MHRLLLRQLKAASTAAGEVDLERLLELVSQAYVETDLDRRRTDRSITLMIEELDQANSELRENQNRRFEAAVSNMSHGLVMFDRDGGLVICNEPYARIYQLPEPLTRPGTRYWDIFDYRERAGTTEDDPPDVLRARVTRSFDAGQAFTKPITLRNGRVVLIHFQPLEDGGWLSTHEDITERHHAEETIRFLAQHDSLTGLANRRTFRDALERAEERIRAGETLAVFCVDLDKFKPINDTQGHLAGDTVLKVVGQRIREQVGGAGLVARLGGDEFAVLLAPPADRTTLAQLAEETIEAVKAPIAVEGLEIRIGASIGIATGPRDGTTSDALMRSGDLALYEAKTRKLGYCFFAHGMDERRRRRHEIEASLRQAIANDEFVLHYQPILRIDDLDVVGCEALLRWDRPGEGLVPPGEFVPIAEETGLIREIGEWALEQACRAAAKWPDRLRISVNVSPVQFQDNDLAGQASRALQGSGLRPERLELEITESLFLADDDHNLNALHNLRGLGARIVLDDFGTGYSSLSYLRKFPFDAIKIDRSFILNVTEQPDSAAIINAIIDLGTALGMDITAEGIETEDQLLLLRSQGCTVAQGFLFSPPLPEAAIRTLLGKFAAGAPLRKAS